MKDYIKEPLAACTMFDNVKSVVDNYIDYYNNRRYQWHLAKLSPNEFYEFCTTGIYPLELPNIPPVPAAAKAAAELGAGMESRDKYAGCASIRAALDGVTRKTLL